MLPPDLANGNGQPPEEPQVPGPDTIEDIDLGSRAPDLDAMIAALGVAVRTNAKMSAGAPSGTESQKYADAALKASQAIVGLFPYANPEAAGDTQTDNPAKKGD